jgi:hypothetical protein
LAPKGLILKHCEKQQIATLISEEALLLAKHSEMKRLNVKSSA